jgi:hypothetical protein
VNWLLLDCANEIDHDGPARGRMFGFFLLSSVRLLSTIGIYRRASPFYLIETSI